MQRDAFVIAAGTLAVGALIWTFWGNPENPPRMHATHDLTVDPEQKFVPERSPYMRNERR
jgi:hypothetical protein